jgi:hypothetical protein
MMRSMRKNVTGRIRILFSLAVRIRMEMRGGKSLEGMILEVDETFWFIRVIRLKRRKGERLMKLMLMERGCFVVVRMDVIIKRRW